jgi:hypothetical protein
MSHCWPANFVRLSLGERSRFGMEMALVLLRSRLDVAPLDGLSCVIFGWGSLMA